MSNPLAGMANIQFNVSNTDISSIFIEQLRERNASLIESLQMERQDIQNKIIEKSAVLLKEVNSRPEVVEYLEKFRAAAAAISALPKFTAEFEVDWKTAELVLATGAVEVLEFEAEDDLNFDYESLGFVGEGVKNITRATVYVAGSKNRYAKVRANHYLIRNLENFIPDLRVPSDPAIRRLQTKIYKLDREIENLEDFDYESAERKLISQMTRQILTASPDLLNQLNTIYTNTMLQLPSED